MFARLNGWALPVKDGSVSEGRSSFGRLESSYLGRPTRGHRAHGRAISFAALYLEQEDADTLEGLLEGRGWHFPFDVDAHSDNGIGPDSGTWSILPRPPVSDGVFGGGYLVVSATTTWDLTLPEVFTVLFWRDVDAVAEHVAVRSDGAKWIDGVRNDAAITTELAVGSGAVALAAGAYDDLVVLPFAASAAFIVAVHRWCTERGLAFYVPFDEQTGRDVVLDTAAVLDGTGAVERWGGRCGGCYRGSLSGDAIHYAAADAAAQGNAEISFELWARADGAASGTLASHKVGAAGWSVRAVGGLVTGRLGVRVEVATAGGLAVLQSPATTEATFAPSQQLHVVFSWAQSTGAIRLWLGGVEVDRDAATDWPGSAASADAAAALYLGNRLALDDGFVGRISEPRFYKAALTTLEVRERFLQGIGGVRGALPRPFSALPALVLDGEIVGGRALEVSAVTREQAVVQHGQRSGVSATGWRNNSRTMQVELEPVALDAGPESLPAPLWSFLMDERYLDGAALSPAQRGPPAATSVGAAAYAVGPFASGRARVFASSIASRFNLTAAHVAALYGQQAATIVAWLRRTSAVATERGVAHLANAAGNTKLGLAIDSSFHVVVRGRSVPADSLVSLASTATVGTGPYHLVGGFLDLANGRKGVFADDAGLASVPTGFYESAAASFGAARFSADAHAAESILGGGAVLAAPFSGDLAVVAVYPGVLTAAEVSRLWRAGRRGILR